MLDAPHEANVSLPKALAGDWPTAREPAGDIKAPPAPIADQVLNQPRVLALEILPLHLVSARPLANYLQAQAECFELRLSTANHPLALRLARPHSLPAVPVGVGDHLVRDPRLKLDLLVALVADNHQVGKLHIPNVAVIQVMHLLTRPTTSLAAAVR